MGAALDPRVLVAWCAASPLADTCALPCGYDDVIGIVEGDYQQESRAVASKGADGREAPGSYLERYVDVSVFGSFSSGRFNRGIGVLPLVRSKAYLSLA